jgi:iron complex outermembrane receptor protein
MSQNSSRRFDRRSFAVRRAIAVVPMIVLILSVGPTTAFASADLTEMSLEELMNIEVTSVSKRAESKMSAAAAITVITAEDIRRGGFTVIPEALRTVPGLQVAVSMPIDGPFPCVVRRDSSPINFSY